MYQELNTSSAQLKGAFRVFKDTSQKLIDSYQALEKQVVRLRSELAAAQNERLAQLTEKERLATRQKRLLEAIPAGIIVQSEPAACWKERRTQFSYWTVSFGVLYSSSA